MDKFRLEVISQTEKPQQVIWAAMHQDYCEDFVWDFRDDFPDEIRDIMVLWNILKLFLMLVIFPIQ
jgi:hypothetical protein